MLHRHAFGNVFQIWRLSLIWLHAQIMYQVFSGQKPPFSREGMPRAYEALIEDCWAPDPEARPTFGAILQRLRGLYGEERYRLAALQQPPQPQQPPLAPQQPQSPHPVTPPAQQPQEGQRKERVQQQPATGGSALGMADADGAGAAPAAHAHGNGTASSGT